MFKEILAIIPARGGSKGLPRKNILPLMGKPLISYTIEEAKKSKYINRIIVSTDSKEIADISLNYGAEVPFLRPDNIAGDTSSTDEVIMHTLNYLKDNEGKIPEIICLLQCTSPLRTAEDIDGTIEKLLKNNSSSAVSVSEAKSNPYWTNIFKNDHLEYFLEKGKKIKRRQDLPKVYELNGAVYVAKSEEFLREGTLETDDVVGYIMEDGHSIDIDNILDFKFAELVMEYNKNRE